MTKVFLRHFLLVVVAMMATQVQAKEPPAVRLNSRSITPQPGVAVLDRAVENHQGPRRFFVQLSDPFDTSTKSEMRDLGIELEQYIPDQTWIARFTEDAIRNPDVRPRLRWVGEIDPYDKMPGRIARGEFGQWAIEPDGRLRLRVRFHTDADRSAAISAIRELGVDIVARMAVFPGATVVASESQIHAIARMDEVLWIVETLPPLETDNDGSRAATGVDILQNLPYDLSGAGINVGITDGGKVDPDHDDFAGRLTFGDTANTSNHATHVAGTLAGSGSLSESNGGSPLQWRGVAPEAQIITWDYFGDLIAEIDTGVVLYDLDVHNNSWGFTVNSTNCELYGDYDLLAPEYDALVTGAGGKRLPIVFSAGNERDDGDCPLVGAGYGSLNPPKAAKNIIVVGATYSDTDGMTVFSSWGPCDDGRLKPDLCAPGDEFGGEGFITSALPIDIYGGPLYQGTSMAAPVVSGVLALLSELYERENPGIDPEPSMLKGLLITTAVDLGNPGPDYSFGHGRIYGPDAADAMVVDTQYVFEVDHEEVVDYPFQVPVGTPSLRVALVWDDPDAAPLSDPALINDLDLVLIAPDLTEYQPWVLDPANPEINATTGIDSLNNVEHILVVTPQDGDWTARITGTNVPDGPQLASLVGLDLKPAGVPIGFAVVDTTTDTIDLDWTDSDDVDRIGTLIVRSESLITWTPVPGTTYAVDDEVESAVWVVYLQDKLPGADPFTDENLAEGTWYHYAAFSLDDMLNYSEAAADSGLTNVAASVENGTDLPVRLALHPARPNPASGRTDISFEVPAAGRVRLSIFDPSGRLVRTLVDQTLPAGSHRSSWNGRDNANRKVASGVYFYQLRSHERKISHQLSWMK